MRATHQRAARLDLGERDWRVLTAVFMLTASWTKLEDTTTVVQIAAVAYGLDDEQPLGWQRDRVGETLRKLAAARVIGYRSVGRGPGARCVVSLESPPADACLPPAESPPATGCLSDERHPVVARNDTLPSRERHPAGVAHREVTEKAEQAHAGADEQEDQEQVRVSLEAITSEIVSVIGSRRDTTLQVVIELTAEGISHDTIRRYLATSPPSERRRPWDFARRVRKGEQLTLVGTDGQAQPLLTRQLEARTQAIQAAERSWRSDPADDAAFAATRQAWRNTANG